MPPAIDIRRSAANAGTQIRRLLRLPCRTGPARQNLAKGGGFSARCASRNASASLRSRSVPLILAYPLLTPPFRSIRSFRSFRSRFLTWEFVLMRGARSSSALLDRQLFGKAPLAPLVVDARRPDRHAHPLRGLGDRHPVVETKVQRLTLSRGKPIEGAS